MTPGPSGQTCRWAPDVQDLLCPFLRRRVPLQAAIPAGAAGVAVLAGAGRGVPGPAGPLVVTELRAVRVAEVGIEPGTVLVVAQEGVEHRAVVGVGVRPTGVEPVDPIGRIQG